MRAFHCPSCQRLVFFHNFHCLNCGTGLGYDPHLRSIVAFDRAVAPSGITGGGGDGDGRRYRRCGNQHVAACNWVIPGDDPNPLCRSCRLTTVRPNDRELAQLAAFADAESAKRTLLDQLIGLGLSVGSADGGEPRLRFRLMASNYDRVVTGYQEGTITLDLSESDDAHRERVRQQLGELYRTVLGHLRHEIGHFYWWLLIADSDRLAGFRELFGDERIDYQAALDRHYQQSAGVAAGPRAVGGPWSDSYISAYAAAHPWEDWAETWAQYLHIRSGLETAEAFGLSVGEPSRSAGRRSAAEPDPAVEETWHDAGSNSDAGSFNPQPNPREPFPDMVDRWLGYTFALNAMARSIGQGDLYPFVLSQPVVDKLNFVHRLVASVGATPR